jgi:hypothetical protein
MWSKKASKGYVRICWRKVKLFIMLINLVLIRLFFRLLSLKEFFGDFRGCSKMFRCKARKKPNRKAYMDIR